MEIWKDIAGYEGLYQVSNLGRVKSLDREKSNGTGVYTLPGKIKTGNERRGYLGIQLFKSKKFKNVYIHRLVAEAFIPNPERKETINHINGNKLDNRVENLEWVSNGENVKHAFRTGLNGTEHMRNHKGSVAVAQYDKSMVLIRTYPSMMEAERQTHIASRSIALCCKGEFHHAGGYIWKYT
jgi:hypothetical protein